MNLLSTICQPYENKIHIKQRKKNELQKINDKEENIYNYNDKINFSIIFKDFCNKFYFAAIN